MSNWENDEALEEWFDQFVEHLKSLRRDSIKILNLARYRQLITAKKRLLRLLAQDGAEDTVVSVQMNPEMGYGSLRMESPLFLTDRIPFFFAAVATADNMEIYSLTDGNLRMGLMFYGMFDRLRTENEPTSDELCMTQEE